MNINEYISYKGHGVGQIKEVKTMHGVEFFSINILDSGLKILIPKDAVEKGDLARPLMDKNTAKMCLLYIKESSEYQPEARHENWNRRFKRLMQKIVSNNPISIAEVVAELNIRQFEGNNLSFGERKMRDAALALLNSEIKLVLS